MDGFKNLSNKAGFEPINVEETPQVTKSGKEDPKESGGLLRGFSQDSSRPRFNLKFRFSKKAVLVVLAVLLVLSGAIGWPAFSLYKSSQQLSSSGQKLLFAVRSQNVEEMKLALDETKKEVQDFRSTYNTLAWTKFIPFIGVYWNDGDHALKAGVAGIEAGEIVVDTMSPYADLLGFEGGIAADSPTKTAEERIAFLVETIEGVTPKLDEIAAKTSIVSSEMSQLNPNRYPEEFKGELVRERIRDAITIASQVNELVTHGKPVLEKAPYLLGKDGERKYLFLWQNDKELRPTGGFITAYSIVKVRNGKFDSVTSDDIYHLDERLKNKAPAPEPIKKYLPLVHEWNLRDMNLSPDFKDSMQVFAENYKKAKGPEYDGIVAVDTYLLTNILKVLETVGVPEYGNYSIENDSRCNCPQVIYELESFADVAGPIVWDPVSGEIVYQPPNADNRKKILGPLMNSMLSNALGQPKEKIPDLFEAGWNSILEKHVLFYFEKEDVQKAMEAFNVAGRIREFQGDYLHINDTNFAGAKSNLYVQQEVDLDIQPGKDSSTNILTIKYKNPQKHDGWLNGPYRDWVRVYVPQGSTLVDSTGSEVGFTSYEELGKTVFDGFFVLRPEGVHELKLTYTTPVKKEGKYKVLIQKQPGTDGNPYTVKVGRDEQNFPLKSDKELSF